LRNHFIQFLHEALSPICQRYSTLCFQLNHCPECP
jgi:hypothetical protein